ncbi:GNAT family N-acetyltransferase [Rossellomorea aquimaris]|uniref:GNAT family N-acetyltransferase n=1 Tax=Rossellomorea aquimaris TaxID=189382 RepID=UPI000A773108
MIIIRAVKKEEAEKLMHLIKNVENQSEFMLMEPGERQMTLEKQIKMIERFESQENAVILTAEKDGIMIGYLFALGGSAKRTRHSAYLAVGILKEFRGQGAGTSLFEAVEEWAGKHGISRLELTAVTGNTLGIGLYKKRGFEVEGTKRNSLNINGDFHDEYYMSKLLNG